MRLVMIVLCVAAAAGAGERRALAAEEMNVATLAWMAGDWQTAQGKTLIEEHWTPPAGGTLLAVGRVLAGERTVFFEFLRIETRPDGVFFVAQPKGNPPTDFKCVKLSSTEVVFENPKHDFPKRVIYRKQPDGTLKARVEGDGTEKEKPQDFHYTAMKR